MANYRAQPSRADRATAIVAVIGVHAALGTLILRGRPELPVIADRVRTVLIDVAPPPPPPPPPIPDPDRAREAEGAAGKKAEPTPVVAPVPRIVVPAKPPVPAAPVAGTGSSSSAGAATPGTGPGAGGSGSGRGGGGSGGSGIGTEARLLGGNRSRLPSRLLRQFAADRGFADLSLTVAESGRVSDCSVLQGTGNAEVDQALCGLMVSQSWWSAARDTQGRPIAVKVRYTAIWNKN